jgi:ribonuclease-3
MSLLIRNSIESQEQRIKRFLRRINPNLNLESINTNDFISAMTAPSAKGNGSATTDYQNLEFLGDSVIQLIVSEKLYRRMKKQPVGVLHNARMQVVRKEFLAGLFDRFGMKEIIMVPKNFDCSTKVKCDFIEALFGALYLHFDFRDVVEFWDCMAGFAFKQAF